jgi:putative ABC transport system substrate-binding protein
MARLTQLRHKGAGPLAGQFAKPADCFARVQYPAISAWLANMQSDQFKRREFMKLFGGAAAWPLTVRAQQAERRIGALMAVAENDPEGRARAAAFRQGLRELGWTEGHNVSIEFRWAADDADLMRRYAAELVGMVPDVLIALAPQGLAAVLRETRSIPTVFVQVADPVGGGFVASLSKPGGNITGFTSFENTISAKWLELIKEVAPQVTRVAIIRNPAKTSASEFLKDAMEVAAPSLGLQLSPVVARDIADIEHAFHALASASIGGIIIMPDPITLMNRERIVALAAERRLPAVYPYRYFATVGGLVSYGPNSVDLWRRAAIYVDRILKGAKPADLPIQNPTKFEIVLNLKTAKALGIEPPLSLLMRIDEVID